MVYVPRGGAGGAPAAPGIQFPLPEHVVDQAEANQAVGAVLGQGGGAALALQRLEGLQGGDVVGGQLQGVAEGALGRFPLAELHEGAAEQLVGPRTSKLQIDRRQGAFHGLLRLALLQVAAREGDVGRHAAGVDAEEERRGGPRLLPAPQLPVSAAGEFEHRHRPGGLGARFFDVL